MKNTLFALLALATLLFASCEKDPPPLDLHTFDVRWFDDDGSLNQTAGDALTFDVEIDATDNDGQYITEWEFTYSVNGVYGGLLRGDDHIETNSLFFSAEIVLANLSLPVPPPLQKGDVVEFRLWARDNYNTEVVQTHRYVLE